MDYIGAVKILGLTTNCTEEEIKTRYKQLAKMYHPDFNKSLLAAERICEVNSAKKFLLDYIQRTKEFRKSFNLKVDQDSSPKQQPDDKKRHGYKNAEEFIQKLESYNFIYSNTLKDSELAQIQQQVENIISEFKNSISSANADISTTFIYCETAILNLFAEFKERMKAKTTEVYESTPFNKEPIVEREYTNAINHVNQSTEKMSHLYALYSFGLGSIKSKSETILQSMIKEARRRFETLYSVNTSEKLSKEICDKLNKIKNKNLEYVTLRFMQVSTIEEAEKIIDEEVLYFETQIKRELLEFNSKEQRNSSVNNFSNDITGTTTQKTQTDNNIQQQSVPHTAKNIIIKAAELIKSNSDNQQIQEDIAVATMDLLSYIETNQLSLSGQDLEALEFEMHNILGNKIILKQE